jgi:parallel beta-helix repeat protein
VRASYVCKCAEDVTVHSRNHRTSIRHISMSKPNRIGERKLVKRLVCLVSFMLLLAGLSPLVFTSRRVAFSGSGSFGDELVRVGTDNASELALDGSAQYFSGSPNGNTMSLLLTATGNDTVVIVGVWVYYYLNASEPDVYVSDISSSPSLTWTKRTGIVYDITVSGMDLEEWYAVLPDSGNLSITINLGAVTPFGSFSNRIIYEWSTAFGVIGAYTASPFDLSNSVPSRTWGCENNAGLYGVNVSTNGHNDFMIGMLGSTLGIGVDAGPEFTIIQASQNSIAEYKTTNSTQSDCPVNFWLQSGAFYVIFGDAVRGCTTITVPDDCPTIQAAINAASDGDAVFVRNGTYNVSTITIDKSISLLGENKDTTIIDGSNSGGGNTVTVEADNVRIGGFTIRNCRDRPIWMDGYVNITIFENVFTGNVEGIRILHSSGNVVRDNLMKDGIPGGGVSLNWVFNSVVCRNIIQNTNIGVGGNFWNCTFYENTIRDNRAGWASWGISDNFHDCVFFHNNLIDNGRQVYNTNPNSSMWDDGYPSGGNYWSDYNGTDLCSGAYQNETGSDNIGDSPYVIDANNTDNFPLMNPYVPFENQTIYIRADGNVDPSGSPILRQGNLYTLMDNITSNTDGIIIERNGITLDIGGCTIQGEGNGTGIQLSAVTNVTVQNAKVNGFQYGICLDHSWSAVITGNNITENGVRGLVLEYSGSNALRLNNVSSNGEGITIIESLDNSLTGNTLLGNDRNFGVFGETVDDFIQDIDSSNTVNGKPIYYWINRTAEVVPQDAGFAAIVNSSDVKVEGLNMSSNIQDVLVAFSVNVTVSDNQFNNSVYGVSLVGGAFNKIVHNSCHGNDYGVGLRYSSDNSLAENAFSNNSEGVLLIYSSDNNLIASNEFEENRVGIDLTSADSNCILQNNFAKSQYGIWIDLSNNNTVYHNNFNNNTQQVYVYSQSSNSWDNTCEGNYWSDYNGTVFDKYGIGDSPYIIDANNTDRYPLMNLCWNPCDINHDLKVDMTDVGMAARAFDTIPGDTSWNPHADITGAENLVPDLKVDMRDIGLTARHFNESYS